MYDTIYKHAVALYNGISYRYDANGCMTTRGSQSIKYNPENKPVRVNSSGTRICGFVYDGARYATENGFNNPDGPFEKPAYLIEDIYRSHRLLPKPWEFPWAGGHRYWSAP